MRQLHLAVLGMVVLGACATTRAEPPPGNAFAIEIAFQRVGGSHVVAPRFTCFAGERVNVGFATEYTYIKGYDVENLQGEFQPAPVTATLHEGLWLDLATARTVDRKIELRYTLRRAAMRRPIDTFEFAIGASTVPVSIEAPELVSDELEGSCHLAPGVETKVMRLPAHEGVEGLELLARLRPLYPGSTAHLAEEADVVPR